MAEVAALISRYGVNMIQLTAANPSIEKTQHVELLFFLDFSDSKIDYKELSVQVGESKMVKEVTVIDPQLPGLVGDTLHFPIAWSGERLIIFRLSVLEGLIQGIRERMGPAGEFFLYSQGQESGKEIFDSYRRMFQLGKRDFPRVLQLLGFFLGWHRLEVIRVDEERSEAIVRSYDDIECVIGRGTANRPYSQLTRGIFSGFFSRYFGKDVTATETRCMSLGEPYCEFTIR